MLPKICFFFVLSSAEFVYLQLFFFKMKFVFLVKIFLPTCLQRCSWLTKTKGNIAPAPPILSLETTPRFDSLVFLGIVSMIRLSLLTSNGLGGHSGNSLHVSHGSL